MQTDEPYSCNECDISFKMTKDVKHDGKKSHNCNQCSYSSTNAASLKRHMLVHSGEKPFVCTQCVYSCTEASHLKKHMLTHSGDRPFNCTQCKYSFTQAQTHVDTFRRKAFQLHTVRLFLHSRSISQDAYAHPFRREAFQV